MEPEPDPPSAARRQLGGEAASASRARSSAAPPGFLTSLGDALSRLSQELGEASRAYEECLARYARERRHLLEAEGEGVWEEGVEGEEQHEAAGGEEEATARDLEAALPFASPGDDALPPAALPAWARTAFQLAPALPTPKGDACPHRAWSTSAARLDAERGAEQVWVKSVRIEAAHGAHEDVAQVRLDAPRLQCQASPLLDMQNKFSEAVSDASELLSGRAKEAHMVEKMIGQRLLARLGKTNAKSLITGQDLHQAVSSMGLERYTLKEMDELVERMAAVTNLRFRQHDRHGVAYQLHHHYVKRSNSELRALAELAQWKWPDVSKENSWQKSGTNPVGADDMEHHDSLVPMRVLIKAMTEQDAVLRKLFGAELSEQLHAIKEVLVTGDANRLVSELTCVRIDDLATRTPEPDVSFLEPFVGMMIIANGVVVGLQTDPRAAHWPGWLWVELLFTVFFFMELVLRQGKRGCRPFFCGADCLWNIFDLLLVGVGIAECAAEPALHSSYVHSAALARFARLFKLMRFVRILRLQFMWELQLMIKGLLGGARTLCWAIVLLIFVLYILGVLCFSVFQDNGDDHIREMFTDVPMAMFTAFRCVTGDCFTGAGTSATQLLMQEYGLWFGVCFFVAYMTITLGLFNVILAIYVETTMEAAKQTEDANKGSKERASIRVAHLTKRLLKLFCAAEVSFNESCNEQKPSVDFKRLLSSNGFESAEVQDSTSISKELFLMVIQEPEVKKLMDELDLPPDRASLFDSIDADGSGFLEATELVRGLLKVRGEVKKSDQVACLLALRAVQATLREMRASLQDTKRTLQSLVAVAATGVPSEAPA